MAQMAWAILLRYSDRLKIFCRLKWPVLVVLQIINKHLLRSLGIFFNGDLAGCSINGDALAGGDALCGSCDSDDCRDAILAGYDSAVRDGSAHFHDRSEERRVGKECRSR